MDILIATTNPGKLKEYRDLLADLPVTLLSLADVGLAKLDVDETGDTFAANAELKARAYVAASGKWSLADDSGLCVDALDGGPGIYTARYGGPGLDNAGRRQKLLAELKDVPSDERGAQFECVIALIAPDPGAKPHFAHGIVRGTITTEEHDDGHGFGYDPVFIPEGYERTFAQMTKDEKSALSHRGRATIALKGVLQRLLE